MKSIEGQLRDLREELFSASVKAQGHNDLVRIIRAHPNRYIVSDIQGEFGFGLGVSLALSEGLSDHIERAARILSGEEYK
jgi:hypothetical protein